MFDPSLMVQQGPNPGERFAQAFQQGQQARQQNMAKAAMAALVQDPSNDKALEALASVDPGAAMQFKQQRIEQAKAQLGAHYDSVLKGGEIIRQVQPKDQAGWNQVLSMAQQAGIPLDGVPQTWDENTAQYAQQLTGLANVFKPQAGNQDPGIIREFDIARERNLIPPGTSYEQYVAMRNPGAQAPVVLPYNIKPVSGGQAAPQTATDAHGNKVQFNPQSGQWEPVGGQTAPAPSATFP